MLCCRMAPPRAVDFSLVSLLVAASVAWLRTGTQALVGGSQLAAASWLSAGVAAAVAAVAALCTSLRRSAWLRGELECSRTPGSSIPHTRKAGTSLPCPYPDAFYVVALSAELRAGVVQSVTVCGRNLVVWRPASPENALPVVMSAYCTHMGAHLGLGGGRVVGGEIRCPFHGWRFDASGACTHVPGADACPGASANVPVLPVREKNGVISVWMASASHREGVVAAVAAAAAAAAAAGTAAATTSSPAGGVELAYEDAAAAPPAALPNLSPAWEIPDIPELSAGAGGYTYIGFTENIVPAHLLECPENGADVAHLPALHAPFVIPWLGWALSHMWSATWVARSKAGERHLADIVISEAIALFGVELPGKVDVNILQAGPSQVFLRMSTPVGPLLILETVTPVSPLKQRTLHALYAPTWFPSVAAKAVLWATLIQYEKDVPVWTSKRYAPKPILTSADKAVAAYRRWIGQFSNASSITYEEAAQAHARDVAGMPTPSW